MRTQPAPKRREQTQSTEAALGLTPEHQRTQTYWSTAPGRSIPKPETTAWYNAQRTETGCPDTDVAPKVGPTDATAETYGTIGTVDKHDTAAGKQNDGEQDQASATVAPSQCPLVEPVHSSKGKKDAVPDSKDEVVVPHQVAPILIDDSTMSTSTMKTARPPVAKAAGRNLWAIIPLLPSTSNRR
eukprot:5309942-Amphidinium_carterae.1